MRKVLPVVDANEISEVRRGRFEGWRMGIQLAQSHQSRKEGYYVVYIVLRLYLPHSVLREVRSNVKLAA